MKRGSPIRVVSQPRPKTQLGPRAELSPHHDSASTTPLGHLKTRQTKASVDINRSLILVGMVAVPFGFSIGDFIAGTRLLIDVLGAFKETSGASSKYASQTVFLHSLISTLQHLDDYVKPSPQNALSSSISSLLDTIRGPLDDFKAFLDKHEASLGKASTKSKLGKVPKTVTYTLKDISGKIERLRQQAEQPLQAINSLLSLQQM